MFSVVVGNPPFSSVGDGKRAGKRGRELYAEFFLLGLRLSDTVLMVLPCTEKKIQRGYNDVLKERATYIQYLDADMFGIVVPIWFVLVDSGPKRHGIEFTDYSRPNKIPWGKGKVNMTSYKKRVGTHGASDRSSPRDVEIFHKITKKKGLVSRYDVSGGVVNKQRFAVGKYIVLIPQTMMDVGWSGLFIVESTGMECAFNGLTVVVLDTRGQAEKLVELLRSALFIDEVNKRKLGFNQVTVAILRSIPIDEETERVIVSGDQSAY